MNPDPDLMSTKNLLFRLWPNTINRVQNSARSTDYNQPKSTPNINGVHSLYLLHYTPFIVNISFISAGRVPSYLQFLDTKSAKFARRAQLNVRLALNSNYGHWAEVRFWAWNGRGETALTCSKRPWRDPCPMLNSTRWNWGYWLLRCGIKYSTCGFVKYEWSISICTQKWPFPQHCVRPQLELSVIEVVEQPHDLWSALMEGQDCSIPHVPLYLPSSSWIA